MWIVRLYARSVSAFLWLASKWYGKNSEAYLNFLMMIAQVFNNLGRAVMMRAISFAIDQGIEIRSNTPPPSEDDGPALNDEPEESPEEEEKPLPTFKTDTGEVLPMNFEPVPDFTIFEALFSAKYGKYGRCSVVVMGKQHAFSARELHEFLTTVANEKSPTPQQRAFYGSIMSVVVDRHGHTFTPKTTS